MIDYDHLFASMKLAAEQYVNYFNRYAHGCFPNDEERAQKCFELNTNTCGIQLIPRDWVRNIPLSVLHNPTIENFKKWFCEQMFEDYAEHIVEVKFNEGSYMQYISLVFDVEYTEKFKTEYERYCKDKNAWCSKYGCD